MREQPATPKLLFTVAEAAAQLGIGRSTLYGLVADGRLKPVHIGRLTRFRASELEAFVNRLASELSESRDAQAS